MAGKRQKKNQPSFVLGAILIVLLLAIILVGATTVHRAAKSQAELANKIRTPAPAAPVAAQDAQQSSGQEGSDEAVPEGSDISVVIPTHTVSLMALGDNLVHNCIYWSAEQIGGGYDFSPYFEKISETCAQYDLACINQETIYVADPSYVSSYPVFGTPVQMADALAGAGFDVVTHATNHCFDKGDTGLKDTITYWTENHPEVTYLGIHDSEQDAKQIRIVESNGIKIAMLNFTYGLNSGFSVQDWQVDRFTTYADVETKIAAAKEQSDFVVVFAHWGEDGNPEVTTYQRTWAKIMADAGAGLIIGSHPHLLQPMEKITAKDDRIVPVFWSLGNFLSHQETPEEMLGGMADVEITKDATGSYVTRAELKPTITVIFRAETGEWYDYCPMLLEDYTEEIAARHRWEACTVDHMQELYKKAIGEAEATPAG